MELHALDGERAVAQAHDLALRGPRGDLEAVGQRRALDDQRVVARRLERARQPREDARAVVLDRRGPPVHQPRRAHHLAAERLRRSPDGRGTRRAAGRLPANARISSSVMPASSGVHGPGEIRMPSGARALDTRRRRSRRCGTTSTSRPELAEVLHEVVGERVVVVDDEDHGCAGNRSNFSTLGARTAAASRAR